MSLQMIKNTFVGEHWNFVTLFSKFASINVATSSYLSSVSLHVALPSLSWNAAFHAGFRDTLCGRFQQVLVGSQVFILQERFGSATSLWGGVLYLCSCKAWHPSCQCLLLCIWCSLKVLTCQMPQMQKANVVTNGQKHLRGRTLKFCDAFL